MKEESNRRQAYLIKNQHNTTANPKGEMHRLKPPVERTSLEYNHMYNNQTQTVVSTTEEIVNAINEHWAKTFENKFQTDDDLTDKWLRDLPCNFGNNAVNRLATLY